MKPDKTFKQMLLTKFINYWPPFWGAGIRVTRYDIARNTVHVEMKLSVKNANYVGTHFGGSLYAMCDPFFMLILMDNLGRDFIVWDKAATIRFKKPGKGRVYAEFSIAPEIIEDIRQELLTKSKLERTFHAVVKNESGEVVAEVDKLLYIRNKRERHTHV